MNVTEFEPAAYRAKRLRSLCDAAISEHRARFPGAEDSREVHIACALLGYLNATTPANDTTEPKASTPTWRDGIEAAAKVAEGLICGSDGWDCGAIPAAVRALSPPSSETGKGRSGSFASLSPPA